MKKRHKKVIGITLGIASLAVIGFSAAIVGIDSYQHRRNQKIIKTLSTNASSKTLVVFFSRSGNTELMARKIAELKNAIVVPIQSDRDKIGFWGWVQSLQDARKTESEITPSTIDLSVYDTIYIGSPVWLYSPAPQVFEFARNNNFTGKKVVLFNSMNSKFEQQYIDDFKNIVERNGGTFEKHLYIIRGRMTQQMDTDSFLKEVEKLVMQEDK